MGEGFRKPVETAKEAGSHRQKEMIVSVKTHPKSRQAKVKPLSPMSYEVWVHETPDRGRANEAVIEAISEHLNIAKSRLRLISGATSRNKKFKII